MLPGVIIPRLNYMYSLKDAYYAIKGIFIKDLTYSNLCNHFGVNDILFVNHARTGMRMVLTSLNLPEGSKIGVSAFTCHTVFQAITEAGHIPVFLDITKEFKIDILSLERNKKDMDALIITHLFGFSNSLKEIREIVSDMPVIEDCAHSFLSMDGLAYTGTSGDFGVFSIGKGKFPSVGEGGIILVNNKKYLNNVNMLVDNLNTRSFFSEVLNILKNLFLSLIHVPFIYGYLTFPIFKKAGLRTNNKPGSRFIEARILKSNLNVFLSKIAVYDNDAEQQKENALLNLKVLTENYELPYYKNIPSDKTLNYFMLPILVESRDRLIKYAINDGIELGRHFSNSITWAKKYGYKNGSCPSAEYVAGNIVTVPTYYRLKPENEGPY